MGKQLSKQKLLLVHSVASIVQKQINFWILFFNVLHKYRILGIANLDVHPIAVIEALAVFINVDSYVHKSRAEAVSQHGYLLTTLDAYFHEHNLIFTSDTLQNT